jgi:hypothetical protein
MIPLGGKIRQPAGEIVSAFDDLLMVQYHCDVMAAASVGRSVVVFGSRRGHHCGVVVDDIQKHNRTNICCTTFISRTSITAATDNWLCIIAH